MVAVVKTFAALGVCALLLTSCVPAGSSDLNLDGLQAQGTLAAVYALQTSTVQAQSNQVVQATIQAGQTESALRYTQEARSATQAAEYQATQFSAAQTAPTAAAASAAIPSPRAIRRRRASAIRPSPFRNSPRNLNNPLSPRPCNRKHFPLLFSVSPSLRGSISLWLSPFSLPRGSPIMPP